MILHEQVKRHTSKSVIKKIFICEERLLTAVFNATRAGLYGKSKCLRTYVAAQNATKYSLENLTFECDRACFNITRDCVNWK